MKNIESKPINPTLETIYSRKSIRKYSDKPIPAEMLEALLRAAMAAPSGKNVQPWEFVLVQDRKTLDALGEVLPFAKMLFGAQAAIVVCGNSNVDMGGQSYWYVDCSSATLNILLAAHSLGLGAVWTATYPYPERMEPVAEILSIPEHIKSLCVIPIGFPNEEKNQKENFKPEKIHYNKF